MGEKLDSKWDIEEHTPNGDYVLHRNFEDGPDVFIAINAITGGFQIEISAESAEGQDLEQIKGPYATFAAALEQAHDECEAWESKQKK